MNTLFKEKSPDAIITIPNIVTTTGILLLIPYVWGFLTEHRWIMFGSLFLSGCSDLADGFLARWLKQKTKIGEIIDVGRDRLLRIAILPQLLYLIYIASPGITALWEWCGIVLLLETQIYLTSNRNHEKHFFRKIRQAGHVFLFGLILISIYFQDVITSLFGFNFNFPIKLALILGAILSFITLITQLRKK